MAYIGAQPRLGNFQACDAITTSSTATFNLLVGGTAIFPQTAQHCLVSLNGVLQAPISSYTISGSTIVFASALTSADSIDFITILGDTLDLGTPSDSTVTTAKLNTAVLTGATDIGAAIADADLFLVDDGAGGTLRKTAASRIKTYIGGGITNAQSWRITSAFTVGTSETDISSNWEESDSTAYARIGSIVSQSSGIFTFGATGIYLMLAVAGFRNSVGTRSTSFNVVGTTNNSTYTNIISGEQNNSDFGGGSNTSYHTGALPALFDVTDTGQVKFRFTTQATGDTQTCDGDSDRTYTGFTIVRLGDT